LYLESGDGDDALSDFMLLRDSPPGKLSLYRARANIEYRTYKNTGSASDQSNMDSPEREQAAYANAVDVIKTAIEKGFAARCKGRAFAGLQLDAALKDCDTALQLDGADEAVHHARGIAEFRAANWAAALAEFNAVLAAHPSAAESLFMKGVVERRMSKNSAGDADIATAKAIDAHVAIAYAQFGILP
jgi:Flp pilus assembly protein TadD